MATLDPGLAQSEATGLSSRGPWLVYSLINYSQFKTHQRTSGTTDHSLYIVNADGSGRTPITVSDYDPDQATSLADDSNRLSVLENLVYLVRPQQRLAYFIFEGSPYPGDRAFTGDGDVGFLASVRGSGPEDFPELIVHELPGGQILDSWPLARCPEEMPDCLVEIYSQSLPYGSDPIAGLQQLAWSPNGRYLAYAAIQQGVSPDLFIYDTANGSDRQLTNGPGYIGKIFWSPDGKWILFDSIPSAKDGLYPIEETFWAISLDGSQVQKLYMAEFLGPGQGIAGWLDDERFLAHDGVWAVDYRENLRLVDLGTGQVRTLFPGDFLDVTFDPNSGVIYLYLGGDEWSWFRLTIDDPTLIRIPPEVLSYNVIRWDADLRLFVASHEQCENGEEGTWVINSEGEASCLPRQPEINLSPDGRWRVVIEEGIWVQTAGGEPVGQIGEEETAQVIWRPDSQGFFLAANQTLYFVSLPDLSVTLVDDQLQVNRIRFQWLGVRE